MSSMSRHLVNNVAPETSRLSGSNLRPHKIARCAPPAHPRSGKIDLPSPVAYDNVPGCVNIWVRSRLVQWLPTLLPRPKTASNHLFYLVPLATMPLHR